MHYPLHFSPLNHKFLEFWIIKIDHKIINYDYLQVSLTFMLGYLTQIFVSQEMQSDENGISQKMDADEKPLGKV